MNLRLLFRIFRRFLRAREAVSALEYAILVGVVVAAVGAALVSFSGNIETAMTTVGGAVAGVKAPVINLTGGGGGGTTGGGATTGGATTGGATT